MRRRRPLDVFLDSITPNSHALVAAVVVGLLAFTWVVS